MADIRKNKMVSVIVPVYNVEAYIDKCLNSLCNQTFKDIEIIVVDDGSTDKSPEIIKKHADIDSRILYFRKDNGGLSSARNFGINKAAGEYIGFVDSDDWVDKYFVEHLLSAMVEDSSDISICNISYINENGVENRNVPHINKHIVLDKDSAFKELLLGKQYRFHAVNKLYKRYLFFDPDIKYPIGKMFEDVATTYKVFYKANCVSIINEKLYYYLQKRKGSILSSAFNDKNFELLEAMEQVLNYTRENEIKCDNEMQCFYVNNVIGLMSQSHESYLTYSKMQRKQYLSRLLSQQREFDCIFTWMNNQLCIYEKCKFYMIKHAPLLYSMVLKLKMKMWGRRVESKENTHQ